MRQAPSFPETMVDRLSAATASTPTKTVITFLADGSGTPQTLSYADLWTKAHNLARAMSDVATKGDRVVLLAPPGVDVIVALYGCFLAGLVAVPAPAPHPSRVHVQSDLLLNVIRDCDPRIILTTESLLHHEAFPKLSWEFLTPLWMSIQDASGVDPGTSMRLEPPAPGDLAVLQYTSGSTSNPKGVMLTHGNLIANQAAIAKIGGDDPDHVYGTWVPHFHDMGLAFLLQPVFQGASVVLMSPQHFMQKPMRWPSALSQYGCTFTAAPNFALDRLTEAARPEEVAELDLSKLRVLLVGAEPVRPETIRRFRAVFSRTGLPERAFCPCYGLAESTTLSTFNPCTEPTSLEAFDRAALTQTGLARRLGAASGTDAVMMLAGNGAPDEHHRLVIVEPGTTRAVADGTVGEIWLSGPSVGLGYWRRAEETTLVFGLRLTGDAERPYLRTGDLGFVQDGQLYIAGRLKEMIIVRGRNLYPADIELTVAAAHEGVTGCAAFELNTGEREGAVGLVIEARRGALAEADEIVAAARRAVALRHEVDVAAGAVVQQFRLPRTSSGKVQRGLCRDRFLAGEFDRRFGDAALAAEAAVEGAA